MTPSRELLKDFPSQLWMFTKALLVDTRQRDTRKAVSLGATPWGENAAYMSFVPPSPAT